MLFNKKVSQQDNIKCMERISKYDFQTNMGIIYFHPYSKISSLLYNNEQIYKFNQAQIFPQLTKLNIYKGLAIYKKTVEDGIFLIKILMYQIISL